MSTDQSWRERAGEVSQVTEHEIELQGVDGEFRLWEKGVRVFSIERESWRVSKVSDRTRNRVQGVDGEIRVWEKGVRGFLE